MKKTLTFLAAAVALTACTGDIEPIDASNKTKEIRFAVASINASNAPSQTWDDEHTHATPWSANIHANTLGVFAFADGSAEILSNQKVAYNAGKWEYSPTKFWKDYPSPSFSFFGYMVEDDTLPDASLSESGNTRTLSFPASISAPILLSADNTPLICHAPHHTTATGELVPFAMDHTLTGYTIAFQLGEKMSHDRHFVINSVKIYGNDLPVSGTVSRSYTLNGGTWQAGAVTWTDCTAVSIAANRAVSIAPSWASDDNMTQRTVSSHTEWVKWGGNAESIDDGAFYTIPHEGFNPTIAVTYDVYTNNGTTLSRKDITSNIILNKENFTALTAGSAGEIQTIKIAIAPDNLYVLADDDQLSGILVVGE